MAQGRNHLNDVVHALAPCYLPQDPIFSRRAHGNLWCLAYRLQYYAISFSQLDQLVHLLLLCVHFQRKLQSNLDESDRRTLVYPHRPTKVQISFRPYFSTP